MKRNVLSLAVASSCLILSANSYASDFWAQTDTNFTKASFIPSVDSKKGSILELRVDLFENLLVKSEEEFEMAVPLPSGKLVSLLFKVDSVFAPELTAKFPKIKSFEVFSKRGDRLGRFSYSSKGLHGMFKHDGKYVMIDPKYRDNNSLYLSYYRQDAKRLDKGTVIYEDPNALISLMQGLENAVPQKKSHAQVLARSTGDTIRTYRLAVAAAGDYTQFHGGTVENGLAAVNVLLNRINEIYLVELAVQFELVANNDKIIYTDPETDPYANEKEDLDANQQTIDSIIGSDNYDIGHLVNGAGGGLAQAAACDSEAKAKGYTGSSEPTGDSFLVDFVAHEIGHQFGANHSYNGQEEGCNTRVPSAAVEPGSGSTIMGYANLCGTQDLQTYSDPSFHIRSIEEIRAFIDTGSASNCGTSATITNNPPIAEAGDNFTIPSNTPFLLTGLASDPDNDPVTFIWEQRDPNGKKTNSPEEMVDNGSNPLFRTWTPQSEPVRYLPRLSDVLENKTTIGETYPNSNRTMNFYLTAKDSKGGVTSDSMKLSTYASPGFKLQLPSSTSGWISGVSGIVRWDTANTEKSPVNCSKVNLEISSDGGSSFEVLERDIDNDGLHVLTAPSTSGDNYRLKISCPTSIFFDVSRSDFSVNQTSNTDTDGDGIPDDVEEANNLNSNDANDAATDADGDGLSNLEEYLLGTDINDTDSDNDGMPDGYEISNGLNPTNAADATEDADGDGVSNIGEFNGQTDPSDPGSSVTLTATLFDFEDDSELPGWTLGSERAWSRDTSQGSDSNGSLVSATLEDSQSSTVTYTGNMVAGDVTFDYKVSSEAGWDKFSFSVDNVTIIEVSGDIDWKPFTYKVTSGEHTLSWTYSKDEVGSSGDDKAWIDSITIPINNGNEVDETVSGGDGGDGGSQTKAVAYDYDGDGKADVAVRRASTFFNYIRNTSDAEIQRIQFGRDDKDIPVTGDFDGDGKADVAVRRPSNQMWYIKNSSNGEIQRINFGLQEGDIPVPADYDGDGITDVAVRRASNQFWYIKNSSDGVIQRINFGLQEDDIPVPADYDGDGKADVAVRRASNQFWYIKNSSDGVVQRINFGLQENDIPIPADYDGDGKADVAVRRASNQYFYIKNSSDGEVQRINFGRDSADIPVPADYDGDGKADVAVRRASNQYFYIKNSSDGEIQRINFGQEETDIPVAAPILTRMSMVSGAASEQEQPTLPEGVAGISGNLQFTTANEGAPYSLNQIITMVVSDTGVLSLDTDSDSSNGYEVNIDTYSVESAETRWEDTSAGVAYVLSVINGSINELNVFSIADSTFVGQFTPYDDSVDIENIELVTRYAGTYNVSATSGEHSRGTVTVGANGDIDFDSGINYAATEIQVIYDRTFIEGEPRVQINYGADDDGPVISLYLNEDLSSVTSFMYRYRTENIETVVTVD